MSEVTLALATRRDWLQQLGQCGFAVGMGAVGRGVNAGVRRSSPHRLELRRGELSAMIVDNHDGLSGQRQIERRDQMPKTAGGQAALFNTVPFEERFNGYNGVARLQYGDSRSPFMPCAAGHNCEFFFDTRGGSYEPRWTDQPRFVAQASSLERLSEAAAKLVIQPGARWSVRVESRFELVAPFYLDIEHSFTPTAVEKTPKDLLGVFWASYLQTPEVPPFYFLPAGANKRWTSVYEAFQQLSSGVIAPASSRIPEKLTRGPGGGRRLLYGVAKTRYDQPFFCGNVNDMLLSYMFQPGDDVEIRFAFNAHGGGPANPAWDYQALVAHPQVGRRYSFKTRTAYKPFAGLDEARKLHEKWIG